MGLDIMILGGKVEAQESSGIVTMQVSGEIAIGCRWRTSSLDVLALQVQSKQEELDHKQDVVAMLHEQCGPASSYRL